MTGISDVYRNAAKLCCRGKAWFVPILPYLPDSIKKWLLNYLNVGITETFDRPNSVGILSDFRESEKMNPRLLRCNVGEEAVAPLEKKEQEGHGPFKWGLLLPICSLGASAEDCTEQLTRSLFSGLM